MSVQAERYLASFILLAIAFSAGVAVMWPWVKWEQHHRKYERQNADIIYIQDRNNALADLKKNYQEHQAAKAAAQKAKDDYERFLREVASQSL